MSGYVLVIDQGTTSTRAIVFGPGGEPLSMAQQEFPQIYPHPGWIEHDPEDLWRTTVATAREAIERAGVAVGRIAGVEITNQRETTLVWDRKTGLPIYNAIVWQDRRTTGRCAELTAAGHEPLVRERTGLLLDPYFSATKIAWILDAVPGARDRAKEDPGDLGCGEIRMRSRPVRSLARGSWPAAVSSAQRPVVRRSCQTMACRQSVLRSHARRGTRRWVGHSRRRLFSRRRRPRARSPQRAVATSCARDPRDRAR